MSWEERKEQTCKKEKKKLSDRNWWKSWCVHLVIKVVSLHALVKCCRWPFFPLYFLEHLDSGEWGLNMLNLFSLLMFWKAWDYRKYLKHSIKLWLNVGLFSLFIFRQSNTNSHKKAYPRSLLLSCTKKKKKIHPILSSLCPLLPNLNKMGDTFRHHILIPNRKGMWPRYNQDGNMGKSKLSYILLINLPMLLTKSERKVCRKVDCLTRSLFGILKPTEKKKPKKQDFDKRTRRKHS